MSPAPPYARPASDSPSELVEYCRGLAERARRASYDLRDFSTDRKNRWLHMAAARIESSQDRLLACNAEDLAMASHYGLAESQVDRLTLTPHRIEGMVRALREIAALPDPVGELIGGGLRPNGLEVRKIRVPIGVLFFIYESRPNVTVDAAAIALKSGNALILRGGKEAYHSSRALVDLLLESAGEVGLPQHALQMVETLDREAVGELLRHSDCIDLVIPRGGETLVRRVMAEATMPVLKHYDGNCHVYVDEHADLEMALRIVVNAKTQRMGVCNAAESLLVHAAIAKSFLPRLAAQLREKNIEMRGDAEVGQLSPDAVPATESDWYREYLGPIISIRIVPTIDAAIEHIQTYGSHHTDAIVTQRIDAAHRFAQRVDSAAVMVNASTRFNDGGELGLGAEIGISTDKLHARGPCGLQELTTYKYVVQGTGQIRE